MIYQLSNYSHSFPHISNTSEEGILCYGGNLDPNRIMNGYTKGIYPWYSKGDPILWWCPNPRFVLEIDDLHISKNLKKELKKDKFIIKYNTSFKEVITQCSLLKRKDQNGTWILPEMIEAYTKIHKMGFAHSFEAWQNGELVGGGYGVVVGDIFCGESMFSLVPNASKIAFVHLVNRLKTNGFSLIDAQTHTSYLESFGAKHISRDEYLKRLEIALQNVKEF